MSEVWIAPSHMPARTDVVVVGGGLAGTAVARFLAAEGIGVVVVDPDPTRPWGVGHVELGAVEQPHRTVASLGADAARALFAFARRGAALLEDDGLLDRCGGLWVAMESGEAGEIPQSVTALDALGVPAAAWTQEGVEARLGGGRMGPALHVADDGRVDMDAVRSTLRRLAVGTTWVTGTARFVHGSGSDGVVVDVDGHRLEAEVGVIAAGPASEGLDASLEGRLLPVRDQFLRTAPVDRVLPLGRAGHGWTAWQQDAAGRLVVSGCRWASPHLEVGETDASVVVPKIQERLEAFLRDRLGVAAPIEARWAVVFGQTIDGLPLVGPLPGDSRRIVCAGFGPSPVAWSLAAARSVADGIVHGEGAVPKCLESRRLVRWRR